MIFVADIQAQNSKEKSEKPDYSPYYFHRVDHFEKLPDTENEIFFLGNSISDGCEWSEIFGDLRYKNRGISGDSSDGILYRLHQITRCQPKQVFLMIGINDLARGRSVEYIINNHLKIYDRIEKESPLTEIIVQSLLPVNNRYGLFTTHTNKGDSIVEINKQLKSICKDRAYIFLDLFSKMVNTEGKLREDLSVDGLHLNGRGYQIWKKEIEGLTDSN
jgi:lysophospholipase L1-like esterase